MRFQEQTERAIWLLSGAGDHPRSDVFDFTSLPSVCEKQSLSILEEAGTPEKLRKNRLAGHQELQQLLCQNIGQ